MQSLKFVPAILFYKQMFTRKVGLIYFLTAFWLPFSQLWAIIEGTIFTNPKFTEGLVTRFTCFKTPVVLQVKIV